jgi:hypothetical protein
MKKGLMRSRIRRIALVSAVGALLGPGGFASVAQSQGVDTRAEQAVRARKAADARVAMLTSHLQLYSGQANKIRAILVAQHEELGARNEFAISRSTDRSIENVLTAKQLASYRALKKQHEPPLYWNQTNFPVERAASSAH